MSPASDPPSHDPGEDLAAAFAEGVALFNAGEFFEAHEVWEDAWHDASGRRKRFLQGLIQCAVALEHARRGNPRGVVTVFLNASAKLADIPSPYMGVPVTELVSALRDFLAPVQDMPRAHFQPRVGRGLDMPIDLAEAPKIHLVFDPDDPGLGAG